MGQIQSGLPDTANSPAGSAAPSADDLLAQLAGDEIDRMLAEAELADPPAGPANAPIPEAMLIASSAAPGHPGVDLTADPSPAVPAQDAFSESTSPENAWPAAQPGAADISSIEPATAAAFAEPPPYEPPAASQAAETRPEVRATEPAAAAPRTNTPAAKPVSAVLDAVESEAAEPRTPLYIRILEFLNSPLNALPENMRNAVGTIAIATLIHSAAVIIYVMRFRRK